MEYNIKQAAGAAANDPLATYLKLKAKAGTITPEDMKMGAFEALTKDQGLFEKAGAAYCLTQQPNLYQYAAVGGFGVGFLVTLLLTYVISTLTGRRKHVTYVTNNTTNHAAPAPTEEMK